MNFADRITRDLAQLRRNAEIYEEIATLVPTPEDDQKTIVLEDDIYQKVYSLFKELPRSSAYNAVEPHAGFIGMSWYGAALVPRRAVGAVA